MQHPRRRFLRLLAGAAAMPAGLTSRERAELSGSAVRLIIGYTPGGSADLTAA